MTVRGAAERANVLKRHRWHRWGPRVSAVPVLMALACNQSSNEPPAMRLWTNDLAFQVSANPAPPPAREDIVFKVVVRDKNSREAIEGGEGRIYAQNQDGIKTWDGLTPSPQPGTYTGKLSFLTAGNWAMGLQFRRDSTRALQTLDWQQEVVAAHGEAVK
jgi:hypothetical protein